MYGAYYFILLATLGKYIKYLPSELRKHILSFIKVTLLCITCCEAVITLKKSITFYYNGYSILDNNCISNKCKKIYNITI
jgi:hypothetical protein